jgi:hypothetical protein
MWPPTLAAVGRSVFENGEGSVIEQRPTLEDNAYAGAHARLDDCPIVSPKTDFDWMQFKGPRPGLDFNYSFEKPRDMCRTSAANG